MIKNRHYSSRSVRRGSSLPDPAPNHYGRWPDCHSTPNLNADPNPNAFIHGHTYLNTKSHPDAVT